MKFCKCGSMMVIRCLGGEVEHYMEYVCSNKKCPWDRPCIGDNSVTFRQIEFIEELSKKHVSDSVYDFKTMTKLQASKIIDEFLLKE